jgi:hypothetical protein
MFEPCASSAQIAEAAAASAFEPFTQDTTIMTMNIVDATFAPKISSVDVYSSASSPTADFDSALSQSAVSRRSQVTREYSTLTK